MVVDVASHNSPQMNLVNECDRGMIERDLNLVAKPLHKDFRYVTHPQSLGKPPMNRDEYLAQTAEVLKTSVRYENVSYTRCHLIRRPKAKSSRRLPTIPSWKLQGRSFSMFVYQFV